MKTAVIGHVEWCDFVRVARVPQPGEIVETTEDFSEPAGGGAVAAVQLARLAGDCTFFTALGDDEIGDHVAAGLSELGVTVEAVRRRGKRTRRGFVYLDDQGERTAAGDEAARPAEIRLQIGHGKAEQRAGGKRDAEHGKANADHGPGGDRGSRMGGIGGDAAIIHDRELSGSN